MTSYNEFASVPESGILCVTEGEILRVYFDIRRHEPPVSDNEPEGIRAASGQNEYVCENVDVEGRTYGQIVSAIVNDRYSADDVQAIQSNYMEAAVADSDIEDGKREEYLAEYAEFQAWRKRAKEVASAVVELLKD